MKLMLIEKYEENDKYKYYVERCSNILEVIDEIICGTIPNIFSYDDQFGIEILKEGNIEEYVDRMCSFYEKESKDYKALSELKKSLVDIYSSDNIKSLKKGIDEFNTVMEKNNYKISIMLFYDYENRFTSIEEKYKFRDLIFDIVHSNKIINDKTYILWDYQSNEYMEEGKWCWSNNLKDLIDYYEYVILDNILTFSRYFDFSSESKEVYGINQMFDEVIKNSDIDSKETLLKIKELSKKLKYDCEFEAAENLFNNIKECFEKLEMKCDINLFKGIKYPEMLIKARGSNFDRDNLMDSLKNDFISR